MNILYYFAEDDRLMTKWQRFHFFDELSHYGINIDVVNPNHYKTISESNNAILDIAKKGNYSLFMTCYCNEKWIYRETILLLKQMGLPTLSFRPDNLVIPYNDKDLCKDFDLLWLTARETQYLYDKWGAKTFFAPYAANPFNFKPSKSDLEIHRVCFIGTPYGSRAYMMNYLSSHNILVDAYCKSSSLSSSSSSNVVREKTNDVRISLAQILTHLKFGVGRTLMYGALVSKIKKSPQLLDNGMINLLPKVNNLSEVYPIYSLSLSSTSARNTDILKHPVNVINLRSFEIPMCGGLQICRYNPELAEYYEPDKEIIFYKDFDELVDKCKFYTKPSSDGIVSEMKRAARDRSERDHTWMNRFDKAFDLLGLKYK